MTPTQIPFGKPSGTHTAKSDLDPTEWKPVLARSSTSLTSDAWTYLSKFHTEPLRPTVHRSASSLPALAGTSSSSHSRVPSLTNTPSVASSVSSTASDYLGMYESRPLPPRHNPYFSGTSIAKGVELVVPHIAINDDIAVDLADSGSIFPASSAVWGEGCEKRSAPISMQIGGRSVETKN
jgi:hypothetical protein